MTPTTDLIARLTKALEGVTKGEWRPGHLANDDHSCDCGFVFDSLDRQGSIATVNFGKEGDQFAAEYPSRDEAKANLIYIIAAQPANIRTLLDALTAQEAELARLREALEEIVSIVPEQRRPHLPIIASILDVAARALSGGGDT